MAKRIKKILIMTAAAAALCQIGMALTCMPGGSVMHMPTVKNTAMVGIVAFAMAAGLELLLDYLLDFGPHVSCGCLIAAAALFAVSVLSFLHPVIADDGRIAFRYPTLAVMAFAELAVLLISNKVRPEFGISKPDMREPGNVFVILASALGIALCILLPHETVIDFDDETHYMNAITTSQGMYTVTDNSDIRLFYWFWDHDLGFTADERRESDEALNAAQNDGSLYLESHADAYDIRRAGYIAPAAGLWIGNALNLSAGAKFTLGRMCNVLLYAFIMGLAIKKLKSGKMLLFVIGMCPYIVFAAACYSYDAWTLAFMSLGLAVFFSVLQSEEKIGSRELVIMVGALLLGCMPKAPYVLVVLLPLLLPKNRFETKRQRRSLFLAVLAVMLFILLMTYLTSFGAGNPVDERGNADSSVSGTAQLIYIFSHPFTYAKTLMKFLFGGYIGSQQYLSTTGYIGSTESYAVVLILMFAAVLTDNSGEPFKKPGIRFFGLAVCLLSIMAVATTMYLIFTPVGAEYVAGCQPRYMIFLLFPVFMLAFNGWYRMNLPRKMYDTCFYVFGTAVLLYNIYELVIVPGIC